MLGFLFGKSNGPKTAGNAGAKAPPARATAAAAPAPVEKPPVVPVDVQLAALAALPEGDDGVLQVVLSAAPDAVRAAAFARLAQPAEFARVAMEARVADTRHAAVVQLHDEALLTQVAQQARTRDKRVYKTARERLDGFARERERIALQAHWLEVAEQMVQSTAPELSRVVELERVWSALQPDTAADQRFQQARSHLREQLQAQASGRRDAERRAQAEAESAAQAAAAAAAAARDAETALLLARAAEATAPLPDPAPAGTVAGAALTAIDPAAAAMPPSVESAPATVAAPGRAPAAVAGKRDRKAPAVTDAQREALVAAVAALEQALEEGHLQDAEQRLNALSVLQSQLGGASGSAGGRIRRAAEEIARLRAWRRWGGQQARDHLCEAAEALPDKELPAEELARAVRALRAQWQEMAAQESGVPHALWERFDAACERAWEPVKAHFAAQAERRAANQARREALVATLQAQVDALQQAPVDWRAVAALVMEAGRNWRTLGPVDRKVSRQLEAQYLAALGALEQPLRNVRAAEEAERAALIRAAEQLGAQPEGRDTVTRLRALQADWQTRSRGVPLPRAREQALWEQFRTACDSVFSARDAVRHAEQAERTAQLQAQDEAFRKREAAWQAVGAAASLCAEAEQALLHGAGLDAMQVSTFEAAWQALPPRPAPAAQPLLARYKRVLAATAQDAAAGLDALRAAAQAAEGPLAAGLLELEIGLGLPSPEHLQSQRRQVQLHKLADSLRSGGRADTASLQVQACDLLQHPVNAAGVQPRLRAVLHGLAPQRPAQVERSARPPRPEGGGRRDGASGRPDGARPARGR